MKRAILSAVTAAMFFAACTDKEDLVPQNQVQDEPIVNEVVQSNVITLEEARENLESLLKDFSSLSKRGGDDFSSKKISDGFTLKSDKRSISKSTEETPEAKIHVFNFENNGGFAIMSATRDMPELLAITEGGSIDTNEVIDDPGLITFLSGLEGKLYQQAPKYDNNGNINTPEPKVKYKINVTCSPYVRKLHNPIGGYCKVHWYQSFPYNKCCPLNGGNYCKVGCVAVACAQLMSIYKYPDSYDAYSFHWNDMILGNNNDDVAKLMRQLGSIKNLNMSYGLNRSSADDENIPHTLENFGYRKGGVCKSYNKREVLEEVKKGYSVILGGYSHKINQTVFGIKYNTYHTGGHSWLVHGALTLSRTITETYSTIPPKELTPDSDDGIVEFITRNENVDYILCNFGWSDGSSNGYYWGDSFNTNSGPNYSESISKASEDHFYQDKITMITGIRK